MYAKGQVWKKGGVTATIVDVWSIYSSVVVIFKKGNIEYEKLVRYSELEGYELTRSRAKKPDKRNKATCENGITKLSLRN